MQIRVLLNSQGENAAEIRTQLDAELHSALNRKGINITAKRGELEAGTLSIAETYEFVISHGSAIATTTVPLITAVLQLSNAILQRRGIKRLPKQTTDTKKKAKSSEEKSRQPTVVVEIDGKTIELPADSSQLRRYLTSVTKTKSDSNPTSPTPKKRVGASKSKKTKRNAQK